MKKILFIIGVLIFVSNASSLKALTINPNPSLDADLNSNIETASDIEINDSSSTIDINSNTSVSGDIEVKRGDIKESEDVNLIDAQSVNTQNDLKTYIQSVLITDSNVKEIKLDSNKVHLTYARFGKILGFIKTNYDIEVKVDTQGKIDVNYPWFAALIKDSHKREVKERMQAEVGTFLDKNSNASGEIEINSQVDAKLINLIHSILIEELTGAKSIKVENRAVVE